MNNRNIDDTVDNDNNMFSKELNVFREKLPNVLIGTIALIKKIAAKIHCSLNLLDEIRSSAIIRASEEIIENKHEDKFFLTVWQMGSGTQTNMSVNQVISDSKSDHTFKRWII
ncbi:lyase family protein [Candidatus Riesia pediculischaeffi]|uniref:lyase family protein n=1 Tax=Candidatus Riesia pediculischaeffi TaxID=428411 RepID=UPI001639E9C6|nr:lyase family protein [Candidatus Riesia pediculischaeffi]